MTDTPEADFAGIEVFRGEDIHMLTLWGDRAVLAGAVGEMLGLALPETCRSSGSGDICLLGCEPSAWILRCPASVAGPLAEAIAGEARLTEIGGGLLRVSLSGPGWRELLMAEGVFNSGARDFAPGAVAGTRIAHVPLHLHVRSPGRCDAYVPASHAEDLLTHWRKVIECAAFRDTVAAHIF